MMSRLTVYMNDELCFEVSAPTVDLVALWVCREACQSWCALPLKLLTTKWVGMGCTETVIG